MVAPPPADLMPMLLDAVCVVNESGTFLSVTGACEQIFGYTPQEMVGRPMMDLIYEPDRAATLAAVDRLMRGKLQYDFENRYVRKDGRVVHIMWSARWYPDKQIRVAVARDVTERRAQADAEVALASTWQLCNSPPCLVPPGSPPIPLSHQDYTVLATLAAHDKGASRKAIVEALGKDYWTYDRRSLDTQMRRLRRKVEQACDRKLPVATLRGLGYRFYDPIECRQRGDAPRAA
ncbi:PAS domain S-box protein [Achromobacter sp. NFACC18-2]|uniref:PAS domain S-box protein n=1 Tax=Achromobacter sp. NFACC18-2 TaxID=1564112 RepID=UPI0008BDE6FF|nr:PAS domain S-box protein [Achromobacter sp. NFACC18-2]SEJ94066.1 PAS domain S-box-containing protein [Achromobacter sp. NFACC18-2]